MEHGICKLSVIPIRTEPSEKSELCSQLLFGEVYSILTYSENKKWIQIRTLFDQYTGWITVIQHNKIPEEYYQAYTKINHAVCSGLINYIELDSHQIMIVAGSILPFYRKIKLLLNRKSTSLRVSFKEKNLIIMDGKKQQECI